MFSAPVILTSTQNAQFFRLSNKLKLKQADFFAVVIHHSNLAIYFSCNAMVTSDEKIIWKKTLEYQTIFKDVLWLMADSALQCMISCDDDHNVVSLARGSNFALSLLGKLN